MSSSHEQPSGGTQRKAIAGLAAGIAVAVVAWEYSLSALLNPDVSWNAVGVGAHMLLDLWFVFPVAILALGLGLRLARRLGMEARDSAGLFSTAGLLGTVGLSMFFVATVWRGIRSILSGMEDGLIHSLALAIILGTLVNSVAIDTLHWRHFFIFLAFPWGHFPAVGRFARPRESRTYR